MSGKHTPGLGMSIATAEQVRAVVSDKLASMERHFIPSAKLTFIMRVPELPDCWMVVSNDPAQVAFAAAPDLLEACKRLVAESSPHTVLVQEHDCVTNARCLVNAIELARAAIKKAEGGK